jgi:hypothetical protein
MEKLFFISKRNITFELEEMIQVGRHITVNGTSYEKIPRRPKGRRILQKLKSMSGDTSIVIYA